MEPQPDQVRVDGVATINSIECFIHQPDAEDPAAVVIELVGEGKNISKCKSCLVKNEIISAENLDANLLALCEKEEKPLVSHNGHYVLENLVDSFSCVAHGLIGKIRLEAFKVRMTS